MSFNKNLFSSLALAVLVSIQGCAIGPTVVWKAVPENPKAENATFSAEITPICSSDGCDGFMLSVVNKTQSTIELDWNKTLYIAEGQSSGGFMFEGIVYRDRNNPKAPDVIFPGGNLKKAIWPNNLVYFNAYEPRWHNLSMGAGERGVYITVSVGGRAVSERISTNLHTEQVAPH